MKKIKALNVFSLIFNLIIVGLVVYCIATTKGFPSTFLYFTITSNAIVGLAALLVVANDFAALALQKRLCKFVLVLKLIGTTGVTLTMLTVLAFLAPTNGMNYAELLGFSPTFSPVYFFFHLVVPLLSIVSFLFFDLGEETKWPVNFASLIPLIGYGVVYVINMTAHFGQAYGVPAGEYDWYGFFKLGNQAIGYVIMGGLLILGFFVSLLLWLINKKHTAAQYKKVVYKPIKNVSVFDNTAEKKQEQPAEEKKEEAPVEENVPEEVEEEQPVEEEHKPKETVYHVVEEKEETEEVPEEEEVPTEVQAQDEQEPEESPEEEEEKKKEEEPKKEAPKKKAAPKKEEKKPAKKEEAKKKEPAKKKEEPKKAAKEDDDKDQTKVYHLTKRKEDGMWAITFVGGKKAVKLFKTKKEAEEYLKTLTENQGATALIRNSKGSKAGKFASSIKSDDTKK